MKEDFDHYVKQKQRRRRMLKVLLITVFVAFCAVFIQECSQSFDQPYNKGYQPVDQSARNYGELS